MRTMPKGPQRRPLQHEEHKRPYLQRAALVLAQVDPLDVGRLLDAPHGSVSIWTPSRTQKYTVPHPAHANSNSAHAPATDGTRKTRERTQQTCTPMKWQLTELRNNMGVQRYQGITKTTKTIPQNENRQTTATGNGDAWVIERMAACHRRPHHQMLRTRTRTSHLWGSHE